MVVNECSVAKQIDSDNGITSYAADNDCSTESVDPGQFQIRQKLMTSSFNPKVYFSNQTLEYYMDYRYTTSLSMDYSWVTTYEVNAD